MAIASAARAAPPIPGGSHPPGSRPGPSASASPGPSGDPSPRNGAGNQSQVSQDAAARSRMHECGHQWSTMKKNGTVGTMTWKEFSATCLAYAR